MDPKTTALPLHEHDLLCHPLLKMAKPTLYKQNSFFLVELPLTASEREIKKQIQRLRLLSKNSAEPKGRLPFEESDPVLEAEQRLQNPEIRLIDGFFYFWDKEEKYRLFIKSLCSQIRTIDGQRIVKLWLKIEERAASHFIPIHDLAVLSHYMAIKIEDLLLEEPQRTILRDFFWKKAYHYWLASAQNEALWQHVRDWVRRVGDPRLTTGFVRRLRESLLPALCSINFQLYTRFRGQQQEADAAWHHEFFLKCGLEPAVLENAFLFSYASVIDRINHFCTVLTTAEHDGADWQSTLQQNFSLVQEPIAILHALLAPGTPLRDELGNKIAKAIAHYSINSCTRQENFEAAVEWLQIALPYATFRPLQDQIQEKIQLAQKQLEHPPCWFCSDYLSNPNSVLWYRVWLNLGNALCFRALPHTMKVEITRCPRCKAVHRQRRLLNLAGLVLGGLLGLAGSVVIYPEMFHAIQHTMLWPLVPGLGMGIGAGRWMESRMSSAIVKPEAEAASHPAVQQCLDTWNLNPSLMRKSHKMGYDKQ